MKLQETLIERRYLYFICLSFVATASFSANILAPAFPAIGHSFHLSANIIHWLMAIYLAGYVGGELIYGPLANAIGRMSSLRTGFGINLLGVVICLLAVHAHSYGLLLFGRLITALGASAGLACTFILIKELLPEQQAKRAMLHVNVTFALGIGIATMLGGVFSEHGHWTWILWALLLHGIYLFFATFLFPETLKHPLSLRPNDILKHYTIAARNPILTSSAFCVGFATALNYCFATAAPSIAIHVLKINVAHYATLNWVNIIAMLAFGLTGANLLGRFGAQKCLMSSLLLLLPAFISLAAMLLFHHTTIIWLFATTAWLFAFSRMTYASAAYVATHSSDDTANAASLMSFINMLTATLSIVIMGYLPFSDLASFITISALLYVICLGLLAVIKRYSKPTQRVAT